MFLRRWRLSSVNTAVDAPLEAREAVTVFTAEHDQSCDLPASVVNPRLLTKPSQYIYGVCDRGLSTFCDGVVKYDTETRTPTYWSVQGQSPGEPISVVNSQLGGTEEDDGEGGGKSKLELCQWFGFHGIYHPQALVGPGMDV